MPEPARYAVVVVCAPAVTDSEQRETAQRLATSRNLVKARLMKLLYSTP